MRIHELFNGTYKGIDRRAANILYHAGIDTVEKLLIEYHKDNTLAVIHKERNFGKKTLAHIIARINSISLVKPAKTTLTDIYLSISQLDREEKIKLLKHITKQL